MYNKFANNREKIVSGRILTPAWTRLRALWEDRRGAIAVMFALLLVPLLGFAGLAVDGALLYSVQGKLQDALDSAALAGARVLRDPGRDARISDYFNANFPEGYLRTTELDLNIDAGAANDGRLVLSAEATVPTMFARIFGFEEVTVSASTGVLREPRGMELALVIDTSGSMDNQVGGGGGKTRMQAVQDAAVELVDHLYGSRETVNSLWISLVPFTVTVNVGDHRTDWLDNYDPDQYLPPAWDPGREYAESDAVSFNGQPYEALDTSTGARPGANEFLWRSLPHVRWKGCVLVREGNYDQTDDPPSVQAFTNQFWPSTAETGLPGGLGNNDWTWSNVDETFAARKDGPGPNLACGDEVTPLTTEKTTIQAAIRDMQSWGARGGTMTNLGLLWGWRTLSPRWRGLWGGTTPGDMPLDYDLPHMDKVIILLTDGENTWNEWQSPWYFDENRGRNRRSLQPDYTAYGAFHEDRLGVSTPPEATPELDSRTRDLCNTIKSEGVTLFTITTQVHDPDIQAVYEACASSSEHYFNLPTAAGLRTAFQRIERELANLRITR